MKKCNNWLCVDRYKNGYCGIPVFRDSVSRCDVWVRYNLASFAVAILVILLMLFVYLKVGIV